MRIPRVRREGLSRWLVVFVVSGSMAVLAQDPRERSSTPTPPDASSRASSDESRRASGDAERGGSDGKDHGGSSASPNKLGDWGSFKPDACTGVGLRQKSSILFKIEGSWEEACNHAGAIIDGYEFAHPARCVNTGFAMWGEFDVPDESCKPLWEDFREGGCSGVGLRRHTAALENVRDIPLEDACRQTPATIKGVTFERPKHCRLERINDDLMTFGDFDVPDTSCGPIYPE